MTKIVLIISSLLILFFGCQSSSVQIEKAISTKEEVLGDWQSKEAMDHFINGTIADMRGDFASAILEYQDALILDKSAGIYYSLAKDYFHLSKLSLALTNVSKAVNLDSANIDYFYLLADIAELFRQLCHR